LVSRDLEQRVVDRALKAACIEDNFIIEVDGDTLLLATRQRKRLAGVATSHSIPYVERRGTWWEW
jgi:hypothetical protein